MSKCNHFHDFNVDFLVTEKVSSDSVQPWILQASLPLAPLVSSLLTNLYTHTANSDSSQVCYSHFHAITPQEMTS